MRKGNKKQHKNNIYGLRKAEREKYMKKMKRLAALFLAVVMVMAMGMTAMADEPQSGENETPATITIENASKGETYKIYKLFDAKVANGSIAYTGTIPDSLKDYFEVKAGNIYAKDGASTDSEGLVASKNLIDALTAWTTTTTPITGGTIVADGSAIEVSVPYGYYVVTSTQGNHALTVASTNPNATIHDKNTTTPSVPDDGKKVSVAGGTAADSVSASIGDTVTYTLKFVTSNYEGSGADAKKINKYIVNDSLPDGLKNFTVTKITIKEGGELKAGSTTEYEDVVLEGAGVPQFDLKTKKMEIPWVDTNDNSLYRNGVTVEVIYTAIVDSDAVIAGTGNVNTFKLGYTTIGDTTEKNPSKSEDSATVKTYALAIKKVDQKGNALKGAEFRVNGLLTEKEKDGVWHVTGKTTEDAGTVMITDDNGILVVKGVAEGSYYFTETKAPEGYNLLTESKLVKAEKLSETTTTTETTIYKDADGNVVDEEHKVTEEIITIPTDKIAASAVVVVNNTGVELPSTGGIGTTIFYVVGGILVLGAGVLLITKKRMSARD